MAHVIVVGVGNIGSHVLPHVARMRGVNTITVIDRDRYEPSNLATQNICACDVGKSKAQVQAGYLRQIDRALNVRALCTPVEDVPLAWLRADVILACLDSKRGRMIVNQAAWRLGVPWIDAGVDASGLARAQVFVPSAKAACLECAWGTRDYELVEQEYPCQHGAAPPETGASSALGALAASLQALECEKLLEPYCDHSLAGRDVMIDAKHHRHFVTRFERNTACLMPDHAGWSISQCHADPSSTTLDELTAMAATIPGSNHSVNVAVAGQQFALTLTCTACRQRQAVVHVHRGEWRRLPPRCEVCGGTLTATGVDLLDRVTLDAFPEQTRNRSLSELGILSGDILTFTTPETEVHLEMNGASWPIEF